MTDEIVAEFHAIKDSLSKSFERDSRVVLEDIKKGESELRGRGFQFISPPDDPTGLPFSAYQRNRFMHRRSKPVPAI